MNSYRHSVPDEPTIPCGLCGEPTPMLGTKRCDRCWELESRMRAAPHLAYEILDATVLHGRLEKLVLAFDQYGFPDDASKAFWEAEVQSALLAEKATNAGEVMRRVWSEAKQFLLLVQDLKTQREKRNANVANTKET